MYKSTYVILYQSITFTSIISYLHAILNSNECYVIQLYFTIENGLKHFNKFSLNLQLSHRCLMHKL